MVRIAVVVYESMLLLHVRPEKAMMNGNFMAVVSLDSIREGLKDELAIACVFSWWFLCHLIPVL